MLPAIEEEREVAIPAFAAAVAATVTTVRKIYFFNGQAIAMWTNESGLAPFRYLHGDHLGSTLVETGNTAGIRWRSAPTA